MPAITQPVVGDIITYYQSQNDQIVSITHRVVRVVKEGYITKGDANDGPDYDTVAPEDVMGIVVFKIPFIGALVHFARTPIVYLTLVIIPSIIVIILEVRKIIRLL
jgi:signal peptidase